MMKDRSPESSLRDESQRARTAGGELLETFLYHRSREVLEALLENPRLGEKHLTILLSRRDLPREIVTQIAQNREWMRSYPLKLAVVRHPRAPRYLAIPLLKFLYLFDLLKVAMTPGVPAELKRLVEEAILSQREGLALGQRLALARQGPHRIAAGLLGDSDRRVIDAALSNPAMTEHAIAAALVREKGSRELPAAVVTYPRWFARYPIKLALLRSQHLSLARVMEILPELSPSDLEDVGGDPRVAENVRGYVARMVQTRRIRPRPKRV